MVGEGLLRTEGQAPYGGVEAVGPDHEVEGARRPVREVDAYTGLVLGERGDGVAEEVLHAGAGVLVHHPYQVLAQQLDVLAVEPTAAEGRLGGAVDLVAVGVEDRHAAHPGPGTARLLQQAHPPHDFERHAADVHGLVSYTHV